jgi:hypothetical protein
MKSFFVSKNIPALRVGSRIPFLLKTPSFGNFTCYFSDSALEINILTKYGATPVGTVLTHTEPMNRWHSDSEFGIFHLLTSSCKLFNVNGTLQGY